MKVVFKKNIKGIGKIDEIKEVTDGYALNFLIPSGAAIRATPEVMSTLANQQEAAFKNQQTKDQELDILLATLKKTGSVTIHGHPHSKGHLYQSITSQEIVHAINEHHHIFVPKELVFGYEKPIKEVGDHTVTFGTKNKHISYIVKIPQ